MVSGKSANHHILRWCILAPFVYSFILKTPCCFSENLWGFKIPCKRTTTILGDPQHCSVTVTHMNGICFIAAVIFSDLYSSTGIENISSVIFVHKRVCMCACAPTSVCVCNEWVPGRKRQRVCGILLSWHKRDMRSPRALVIMRECIVAVFKTWQHSASAAAAQWMQALESWLELASVNNVTSRGWGTFNSWLLDAD